MIVEPVIHTWQGNPEIVGSHICLATQKLRNDWFSLFLTDTMINNIVYHTNAYVAQQKGDGWPKLIAHKFNVWLGLIIAMEIHKLPSLELYWSNRWLYTILQFKVVIL